MRAGFFSGFVCFCLRLKIAGPFGAKIHSPSHFYHRLSSAKLSRLNFLKVALSIAPPPGPPPPRPTRRCALSRLASPNPPPSPPHPLPSRYP
ncbi:hypothetical protein M427DRAFT_391548 [Gonapodya prolifera JEL478]|uniref:Secreted protein n=1 Tax=Gonapodya prolifera (strain JEL478) TaxID=1344416 RepID=A0A139A8M6_GONPJ|nr:hypothetical protein M427DRAFT_391548 [Gonapodya prolifera JEL478]|eukprot:KXS12743.1 hypothetical protein M427DRAFT_391548 [Gonapodya prolifera JEL478]